MTVSQEKNPSTTTASVSRQQSERHYFNIEEMALRVVTYRRVSE
jgi:hypothetical protein